MLVAGVMSPVMAFIVRPAVDVKLPPCVPVSCTPVAAADVHNADGYTMDAAGAPLTVTVVVVVKSGHPLAPGMVYFMV